MDDDLPGVIIWWRIKDHWFEAVVREADAEDVTTRACNGRWDEFEMAEFEP